MARPVAREGTRPFKPTNQALWNLKIQGSDGEWYHRSTGYADEATAHLVADKVHEAKQQGLYNVLDMIAIQQTLKLKEFYDRLVAMQAAPENAGLNIRALVAKLIVDLQAPGLRKVVADWVEAKHPDGQYVKNVTKYLDWLQKQPGGSDLPVTMFTADTAKTWLKAMKEKGYSPETQRHFRVALSQFGQSLPRAFLAHCGGHNPISRANGVVVEGKVDKEPRYYLVEQIEQMIQEAGLGTALAAAIALCFSGAVEWSALEGLRVQDIDRTYRMASLFWWKRTNGKFKRKHAARVRDVCITHQFCWDAVEAYLDTLPAGTLWLMPRPENPRLMYDGQPVKKGPIPRCDERSLRAGLIEVCEKIGVEHEAWHRFRHSFACFWILAGCEQGRTGQFTKSWCKTQMGHSPRSVLFEKTYGAISHKMDQKSIMARELGLEAPKQDLSRYLRLVKTA